MMNPFAVDQACAELLEIRLKYFHDSPSRRTVLHGEENCTLSNRRENHVSEQVDHADYDFDNMFLPRGVKKENCASKREKIDFHKSSYESRE